MSVQLPNIQHDGGTHDVSVETEGDQCVIKFGGSFTLRVDEANLNKLREMIHIAARDLTIERRDTAGAREWSESGLDDVFDFDESDEISGEDLKAADEIWQSSVEADMIQRGIDAREMMKGTASAGDWNPNDPSNW